MGSMEGILKEELGRLRELVRGYRKAIRELPKGSLQQKRIHGITYPYLVYRRSSRVISKYLGQLSELELKQLKEKIEMRKKYQGLLRETRQNQSKIHKMLYGKKRTI